MKSWWAASLLPTLI